MQHNTQSTPLNNMNIEASLNSSTYPNIEASLITQQGFLVDNPPMGLLTKTQPSPWAGFSWAGLGGGRVLARSR